MSKAETNPSHKQKKIKKRLIEHEDRPQWSKHQNCPKFIVGSCWLDHEADIKKECLPEEVEEVEESFMQVN